MITSSYPIDFVFPLEASRLKIQVTADVEVHHSTPYYVIRNFRSSRRHDHRLLPDIAIKKVNGRWVHTDSEKETFLCTLVGRAIDAAEKAVTKVGNQFREVRNLFPDPDH